MAGKTIRTLRAAVRSFWNDVTTPSRRDERPYLHILIAIGHAMLGAVVAPLLGSLAPPLRVLLVGVIYAQKERADLEKRGMLRDGIVDAGFVMMGAVYQGPILWPLAILVLATVSAAVNALLAGEVVEDRSI